MKKIITLISVLLICITTFGQFPQNPTQGQTQIKQTNLGAIEAQRGLKAGQFVDTSAANAVLYMKGVAGILIYTTSDNNYWYRSADTTRWVLIATTTSNCAGTQLISGSITWSGSGLVYDATDLDYYILCSRYFANSTTLTLAVADPTYPRIDKFYADITGAIGVITGTPATNPQEPQVNMLNQIDLGFVYIPAGSTVPAGTTQTVIYNENVEWSGTSDVPSVNFDYATNPYIGSLSTYLPSAPNSSYVEWQSNGIDYLFSDAQYLKFWVRLNANFTVDPLSFLDVTFEYTDVTVSQTLAVGNGDYNMDYSLINQWQLVSIPLTGITTYGTDFNSVHFVINSAPTSFQLDYIYLLETATIPPAPVGGTWLLNGNSAINDATQYIGTRDAKKLNFGTNGQIRAYIDTAGIELLIDDTTANVMLIDSNGKIWKTYQPTILADSPLVIYLVGNQRHIKADTTRRGAALATQYYADSVANAGGGGWSLLGNAGTVAGTNFVGTTDNVDLVFKRNGIEAGRIGSIGGDYNTYFGVSSGVSNISGTANTGIGYSTLFNNTTGNNNTAVGDGALGNSTGEENTAVGSTALLFSTTGNFNTAIGTISGGNLITGIGNVIIGSHADVATSSTDSSVAIGYEAVASTKQVAFSPHLTTMFLDLDSASGTAPAIAGIDENGNWRKYATPAGGSSQWTDTTAGIYYADKVGIGGVINPANALTVSGSATVGTGHSNAGTNNFISGSGSTVGTGGNNIIAGSDHNVANNSGANVIFGESHTFGNAEASSIIYGALNTVGDGANDALVGGTGSSVFAVGGIALGVGNEAAGQSGAAIGGSGNYANGSYSGLFAGAGNTADGINTVVLGGHNITATDNNTAYVENFVATANARFTGLPTSGTYSKSLAIDASGNIYKKDTLAVSGVYAPLASPTFTGTVNLPATTFNGILSSTFNASFNNLILLGGLYIPKTITAGGTTGAQTINKPTGSVNFAAGATTLVVTNSLVSSTSLVIVQVYGTDVTATSARVTLATGSFTITLNAAATAETKVGFFVTN